MADEKSQNLYTRNEKVVPVFIEQEMKTSYLNYAMSVIVGRALPDVRDGLKPVHRRILYAMHDLGMDYGKPHKKSARIVGECFVKDTLVLTRRGLISIQEVQRGDHVYTEKGICPVTELYEMPPKFLLTVLLENGTRNTVTSSQRFRVLTPNLEFAWKEARELTESDYVVIRAAYPDQIDSVALEKIRPEDPDQLDERLAYLLGFWLSDGWIEKAQGRVGFYSTCQSVIESIVETLRQCFSLPVKMETKPYIIQTVTGPRKGIGYQVRVSRSTFAEFLALNFGIVGWDALSKEIPQALFRSPRSVVWAFVSGLIDGDGSIHLRRNVIHYGSISSKLINQLTLLLQHQGIFSHRVTQNAKRFRVIDGRTVTGNNPLHAIEIRGSSALLLANSLALLNAQKHIRLHRIAGACLKKSNYEVVPYAGEKIFSELSRRHIGSGWYQALNGSKFRQGVHYLTGTKIRYAADLCEKPLRKSQIAEWGIAEKLNRIGSPLGQFVNRIERDGLYFLKVVSVQQAPAEKTYDLQVKGDHQFIANGMVVHNCLGKYHPHGDTAVYDTLVRMAQDFSMRYPLIDGQGNFGSIDGDSPASMRYTEARLAAITVEMLADIDKNTVNFAPNFDETLEEPTLLPAALPNLLCNGSSGIAVGMATNIPPHNLNEVADAIVALLDNPEIDLKDLMKHIKGPDFPTGAMICGTEGIRSAYETGRGLVRIRAKAGIEELKGGKQAIVITEIPYQVNKSNLIETTAELVNDKKIEGISDVRDESDKDGMRLVIDLKRDANAQVILNQLYKHTQMQETFGIILLALVDGSPRVLKLKEILSEYIRHRKIIIVRRTQFDLDKAKDRAHIVEGLIKAVDILDKVIKTIRKSKTPPEAKTALVEEYEFSERQAQAILEMQLQKLTGLEIHKLEEEFKELLKRIEYLESVLKSEKKVLEIIREELAQLKEKYGDERRTEITRSADTELQVEDLIADEDVVVTISHQGYVKRLAITTYRKQRRGGVGVGSGGVEEDFVEHLFIASTHDNLLLFTSKGKAFMIKVHEIPQASRIAKGKFIANFVSLAQGEKITSYIPVRKFEEGQYLVMATRMGQIKKCAITDFENTRRGGIIAIGLDDKDELIEAELTDGNQEIFLATRKGKAIRFPETLVRSMGRAAGGVRGVNLEGKDYVIGMEVVDKNATLLSVTEKGFGKRSEVGEYRITSRGGKGVTNVKVTDKNGEVVGLKCVTDKDDVMIMTQTGMVVRCSVKDIRETGRVAQGVRLINLKKASDKVSTIAKVEPEDEETVPANSSAKASEKSSEK